MTSQPDPFESHVQGLFCFALGVLSGVQAANRLSKKEALSELDVPEAYVFAGGGLDALAGDAFLRSGQRWFIIEMKRTVNQLDAELHKPRVRELRDRLSRWRMSADAADRALWKASRAGHAFIYGCNRAVGGLAIATRSYSDWLIAKGEKVGEPIDLVAFIELASDQEQRRGFTREQLMTYLASMNEKSGAPPSDEMLRFIEDSFTIGIDSAGQMTIHTLSSVLDLVKKIQLRAPRPQEQSTALTQTQAVMPPSPGRPRPGR